MLLCWVLSMGLGRSVVGAAGGVGGGGLFIPALRRGNRVVLTWSLVGVSRAFWPLLGGKWPDRHLPRDTTELKRSSDTTYIKQYDIFFFPGEFLI